MSALRRASWGMLVLLIALTACRKREEGPEGGDPREAAPGTVRTEAVAGDLPAGANLVVSVYDLQSFWDRLQATQLYTQIRAIPQVDSLLDPSKNPQLAGAFQEFQQRTGLPLNEQTIFSLTGKKLQLGMYPSAADTTAQRVVLVADMGDRDAVGSILNSMRTQAEGRGATFGTEEYRGVEVTVVSDAGGDVTGLYGFHKDKLVASTDQAGLQSAVNALDGEGGTMEDDSLYQRALTKVGEATVTVFVSKGGYRGLVGAMQRAAAEAGQGGDAAAQEASMEIMDKYNFQSATIFGTNWTDEGLQFTNYSALDPTATGAAPLREMLDTPASEVEVMGYFPDSTLGFYAVNFLDAPKVYDWALTYFKDMARTEASLEGGADVSVEVDSAIARFERQTGINVRNDILSWVGKEVAVGLNGVVRGGFFPVPEVSLAVQTTDAAKSKALMDKVEAQLVAAVQQSGQGFPVQFQQEDYKGVTLRFAPTPMGEGLAPGYAIHEEFVIVALSRNTLRRMIDVKTGAAPPVGSAAAFQALSDFFPGEVNIVGFANTVRVLDEVSSAMGTFQQMSGQQPAAETQDTVTRVVNALKNIQAVGSYGMTDERGVEQRFLIRIQ
ncbi:MAG: DUF3352 domain-containing protein [Gemmatimonadota bacterium]